MKMLLMLAAVALSSALMVPTAGVAASFGTFIA